MKFSEELVGAEFALLCGVAAAAIYLTLIRKKKKESAEWVPAALVRAYLDKARADEADLRYRLFGEATQLPGTTTVVTSNDPALAGQIDALRTQLAQADQRAMDFDRMLNGLRAEKSALEQKLAAATTGAPVAAGPAPEVQKQLDDLKAKLQEYEVIEDDLANLKKFQKENEALRVKVEQYEKGGATTVAAAAPAAPTEVKISGGAPQQGAELKIVSGAAPAPAAEAPKAPETNTNVLAPVTPTVEAAPAPATAAAPASAPAPEAPAPAADTAAPTAEAPAAAAPEKSPKEKEAELLSEFEKMLAS